MDYIEYNKKAGQLIQLCIEGGLKNRSRILAHDAKSNGSTSKFNSNKIKLTLEP